MPLSSRKQTILVITAAIGIILASIFSTLVVTGRLFDGVLLFGDGGGNGYQNITFTDAVLTCQDATRQNFGSSLRTLVVDDHSSRFDPNEYLYKIFIKVETPAAGKQGVTRHYVNCFVRSANGRVNKFEAWEDKEERASPVTDGGSNMFGWPR